MNEIERLEYRFLIIIIIIRNELQEIERLEYRFLIIMITIIIIIRNELQEIERLEYRFLIIIIRNDNNNMDKQKGLKGLWN